jgi:hypothetical protein
VNSGYQPVSEISLLAQARRSLQRYAKGVHGARSLGRTWNIVGILDLVVAVTTGFLTAPSVMQVLALDRPNELITAYPLVMIPAFMVPLSIILHALSLWKLRQQAEGDGDLGAP